MPQITTLIKLLLIALLGYSISFLALKYILPLDPGPQQPNQPIRPLEILAITISSIVGIMCAANVYLFKLRKTTDHPQ